MNNTKTRTQPISVLKYENQFEEQLKLLSYYENAGPDYESWSPNFNMHFGYYKMGRNPFKLESMLEEMNHKVLQNLNISQDKPAILADMGCGLSATMRHACNQYPLIECKGVTVVPWQKEKAHLLNKKAELTDRIKIYLDDYTQTSFKSNSVDHVIAVESSCYAKGASKSDLLQEIHRILKPNGTFVIVDGFLKSSKPKSSFLDKSYRHLCDSWALTELGNITQFSEKLRHLQFEDIKCEDISWKVAPSVAHVPYKVTKFLLKQLLFSKSEMNKERWDNLKSPLLTMILGLNRSHFGYYLVKGTKAKVK